MNTTIEKPNILPLAFEGYTFEAYLELVEKLVVQQATTGPEQSPSRIEFTRLNLHRMQRAAKQFSYQPEQEVLEGRLPNMEWLLLTESWCGDAAHSLPAISQIAHKLDIPLHIIMRDTYPDIMEMFLTNGAMAIPKLIMYDAKQGEVLHTWGPRPAAAQIQFRKNKEAGMPYEAVQLALQNWYNKDKNLTLQSEINLLLRSLLK